MEERGTEQKGAKTTRAEEEVHKKGEGMTNVLLFCLG